MFFVCVILYNYMCRCCKYHLFYIIYLSDLSTFIYLSIIELDAALIPYVLVYVSLHTVVLYIVIFVLLVTCIFNIILFIIVYNCVFTIFFYLNFT